MAAVTHILRAFDQGKHVINATVEADAFCGPGFSIKAHEAGVIYSMAYGDQPYKDLAPRNEKESNKI